MQTITEFTNLTILISISHKHLLNDKYSQKDGDIAHKLKIYNKLTF